MDTDGEVFQQRAYKAEKLLDSAINFILSKGLYNEYMKMKENSDA